MWSRYMWAQEDPIRTSSCGETIRIPCLEGSIATPSLEAAIINAKYVNSNPLDRDFPGISRPMALNLSKQTMSNWTVWTAERYLKPVYERMRERQLEAHVNQCDETPLEGDPRRAPGRE